MPESVLDFRLKTYRRFEDLLNRTTADPLASLLAAVGGEEDSPIDASIWPSPSSRASPAPVPTT